MKRPSLVVFLGFSLIATSVVMFGYACYDELASRRRVDAPHGTNFGLTGTDLLYGRTRFEKVSNGSTVFSLDTGPRGESRVITARAAVGIGLLGFAAIVSQVLTRKKTVTAHIRSHGSNER